MTKQQIVTRTIFWGAFLMFLGMSIPHLAWVFHSYESVGDGQLDTLWWCLSYGIAVSIDMTIAWMSHTISTLQTKKEVSLSLTFISALVAISWYLNWIFSEAHDPVRSSIDVWHEYALSQWWLFPAITVGQLTPIIISALPVFVIAYTYILAKLATMKAQAAKTLDQLEQEAKDAQRRAELERQIQDAQKSKGLITRAKESIKEGIGAGREIVSEIRQKKDPSSLLPPVPVPAPVSEETMIKEEEEEESERHTSGNLRAFPLVVPTPVEQEQEPEPEPDGEEPLALSSLETGETGETGKKYHYRENWQVLEVWLPYSSSPSIYYSVPRAAREWAIDERKVRTLIKENREELEQSGILFWGTKGQAPVAYLSSIGKRRVNSILTRRSSSSVSGVSGQKYKGEKQQQYGRSATAANGGQRINASEPRQHLVPYAPEVYGGDSYVGNNTHQPVLHTGASSNGHSSSSTTGTGGQGAGAGTDEV